MAYQQRTWEELRLLWEAKGYKLDSIVDEFQKKFGEKGFGRSTISEVSHTTTEAPEKVVRFVEEELLVRPEASPRKYEVVTRGLAGADAASSVDVNALANQLGPRLAAPPVDAEQVAEKVAEKLGRLPDPKEFAEQVADKVAARVGRSPDPKELAEQVADKVAARVGRSPDPEQLAERVAARVQPGLEVLAARTRLGLEALAVRLKRALEAQAACSRRDTERLARKLLRKLPRRSEQPKADELAASVARRLGPLIAAAVQAGMRQVRQVRPMQYGCIGLGLGVVLGGLVTGLAVRGHGDLEFHQRLVEEQQKCVRALDQLSQAQQSLLALLAQPHLPRAIDQAAKERRTGEIPAPLAAEMGSQGPWKIPDKPYKWQKKAPCDPAGAQEEINGGCWLGFANAPCPPHSFQHNNRCYQAVGAEPPAPRTEDPGGSQAR